MALATHGDQKYLISEQLGDPAEWSSLRLERRLIGSGAQNAVTTACTEIVLILSGKAGVSREGDGRAEEGIARPGTAWIVPAGTHERRLELSGSIETLHIFLPPTLIEQSALEDYEIDPVKAKLAYAGGFADPMLQQLGAAFQGMLGRPQQPTDRLMVDGMQTALAGHLLGNYGVDRWQPQVKSQALDPRRLKRVLDFVEARLADDIGLEDLAAEACLSPFHFSRLFREATGLSPSRYVTDRRVQAAREKLGLAESSLVEIALDTGFGSQANFIRVFRKMTGLTPGQYREIHRH
ncbi:helix-turn-helix transcriptional regulator [Sphingobium phenoxybenzoativorans]|uniref:Helix-turn-helix transcriptional regulator n=1 Tax=Sphingobium phenoxybenzoativorans TaxID=1592790 RepID=A0A975K7W8_9SPHN|nr:AraC family transcriptional regulator [Sphingobium phenoxybenzoativorans]QUT05092.1 helix-turn-helix transcriptional regulator [Sphingobium phenoxybenzoativorans]